MTLIRVGNVMGINTDNIAAWYYYADSDILTIRFVSYDMSYQGATAQALLAYLNAQATDVAPIAGGQRVD